MYSSGGVDEIPIDSLASQGGDETFYVHCNFIDTALVFGSLTPIKHMVVKGVFLPAYELAKGIGVIQSSHSEDNPTYPLYDYYYYDLVYAKINGKTYGTLMDVESNNTKQPLEFTLYQNYPNPFNPITTISFSLPLRSFVSLKIFDLLGREVEQLVLKELPAGTQSYQWNASKFSSGIYFYRLHAGTFTKTKKFILLK